MPLFVLACLAISLFALSVFGLRGLLEIQNALKFAELQRLLAPMHWRETRAWLGAMAGVPVYFSTSALGGGAWLAAATVGALGYWVAPLFLASARLRAEQSLLDDLPLHLDLIALAMEAGLALPAAIATCMHRVPEGALQRAWSRVVLDIHAGADPAEALRAMEQRIGSRQLSAVVNALRVAGRHDEMLVEVLRERARNCAAHRFARAEHRARAAPLRLWAAMMLAIAPCTLVVLAFPMARLLAKIAD